MSKIFETYLNQIPSKVQTMLLDEDIAPTVVLVPKDEIKHPDGETPKSILVTRSQGKLALFTVEDEYFAHGEWSIIYSGMNLGTGEIVAIKRMSYLPSGWQFASELNHPRFLSIYAFGESYSSELKKSEPKMAYIVMEKAKQELSRFCYQARTSIGVKRLIDYIRDMFEINVAFFENSIVYHKLNHGSFLLDNSSKHIKVGGFDEYRKSEDKVASLWIVYTDGIQLLFNIHSQMSRYSYKPADYLNQTDSTKHEEDYLLPEHLSVVQAAEAAIEKIDSEAKSYCSSTMIDLNNLNALRSSFNTKITEFINAYEFQRLKLRSPHLDDKILQNFMRFCELLGSELFSLKDLMSLRNEIPDYLFRIEGASIMDILLDMNISSLSHDEDHIKFILELLEKITPRDREIPSQYYNAQHVNSNIEIIKTKWDPAPTVNPNVEDAVVTVDPVPTVGSTIESMKAEVDPVPTVNSTIESTKAKVDLVSARDLLDVSQIYRFAPL
ncbi:MAG: hypothetical protein JSS53_07950 [Proteobacteria bacterium]|nr:hypothetical protein [Pseudomonadota bacterium]